MVSCHGCADVPLEGCQPDIRLAGGKTTGLVVGHRAQNGSELYVWSGKTGALLCSYSFGPESLLACITAVDAFAERYVAAAAGRLVLVLDLKACEPLAHVWHFEETATIVRFLPERPDGTATLYVVSDSTVWVGRVHSTSQFPRAMPPGPPLWDGVRCFDAQGSRVHDTPAFVAVTGAGALVIVLGDAREIHTVAGETPYLRAVLTNHKNEAAVVTVDENGEAAVHTRASGYAPTSLGKVGANARLLGTLTTVLITTGQGAAVLWP